MINFLDHLDNMNTKDPVNLREKTGNLPTVFQITDVFCYSVVIVITQQRVMESHNNHLTC